MERPMPVKDDSERIARGVLAGGGVVVAGLLLLATWVLLRKPAESAHAPRLAATPSAAPSAEPVRLEPSSLLAEARRKASEWHRDAVLVSLSATHLDARGVAPDGAVELIYARPAGQRLSGGADTNGERFTLRSSGGVLEASEGKAGKGRVAPEPNCVFEDAWAAAQRAGAATNGSLRMRYVWSEKHSRPVWEVLGDSNEVLRRLDGVSCSILTR
jgi:hypothetical protein